MVTKADKSGGKKAKKAKVPRQAKRGVRGIDDDWLGEMGWREGDVPAAVKAIDSRSEIIEAAKREFMERMFGRLPKSSTRLALTAHIPAESKIVGVGFGLKQVEEHGFHEADSIRVYVSSKRPRAELTAKEAIPPVVNGILTDVIEIGTINPHQGAQLCGGSVGSILRHDGTLGCLVQAKGRPGRFLMSSNHVIADLNDAPPGAPVFAPGLRVGGDPNHPIARLTAFPKLVFGGTPNFVDVAIAELANPLAVAPEILGIGRVQSPPLLPSKGMPVKKHGFATQNKLGIVFGLSEDLTIPYGVNRVVHYTAQLAIRGDSATLFSAPGDSGAIVLDFQSSRPVGMINGGIGPWTIASRIDFVLGPNLEIL